MMGVSKGRHNHYEVEEGHKFNLPFIKFRCKMVIFKQSLCKNFSMTIEICRSEDSLNINKSGNFSAEGWMETGEDMKS